MATSARPTRQEQEPASKEVTEVAPDILRMQLPISLPGLGHVSTYALCDDRGVAVVDPGLPGKASWDALVDRLGKAGYGVKDVHTVIVTHSHPDHFGGAGVLRHRAGPWHESWGAALAGTLAPAGVRIHLHACLADSIW